MGDVERKGVREEEGGEEARAERGLRGGGVWVEMGVEGLWGGDWCVGGGLESGAGGRGECGAGEAGRCLVWWGEEKRRGWVRGRKGRTRRGLSACECAWGRERVSADGGVGVEGRGGWGGRGERV